MYMSRPRPHRPRRRSRRSCWSSCTSRSSTSPACASTRRARSRGRRRDSRSSGGARRTTRAVRATRCFVRCETALLASLDRARARHARRVRADPPPLLRAQRGELHRGAADRAARHRHRHRAQLRVSPGRHHALAVHARRRARDVLHRDRLQQRRGPAAAAVAEPGGGVGRSRRRHLPDLPVHHVPADALGAARRRRCSRSRFRSTRSSSRRSRPAAGSRRCHCGSSTTCSGRTTSRS